jgi:YggT family protein
MNFGILIVFVRVVAEVFVWIVIGNSLLSFFVPPYHPVREALGKIVDPFLEPIRRILPAAGGLDFSPLVLILAVEFISRALIAIFSSFS